MRHLPLLICVLLLTTTIATAQLSTSVDQKVTSTLVEYVTNHFQTPEDYVVSSFTDHDIIFLGEWHRIRHDPLLVQRLIPLVYEAGVHYLGFEFARRIDQPLIDSLLTMPEYDEELANQIVFRNFVHWGYREYTDIFRAAWRLNRGLPEGAPQFRILGLNNAPDWSVIKTQEDRDKGHVMRKVWHGETEEDWANVLIDVVVSHNEKALVYCGIHHAFTEYRQPIVADGKFIRFGDIRLGNHVYRKIGKRAMTVYLHAPWVNAAGYDKPSVRSADGYVDAAIALLDSAHRRFGVRTKGTPFGDLPGRTSIYSFGYENFTLSTFCDGYICQGPLSSYIGVTPLRDFVNEQNIGYARAQSPNPRFRDASIEDFYEAEVHDADIPRRLRPLW